MRFISIDNRIDVILVYYLTSTPAAGQGLVCAFFVHELLFFLR